MRLESLELCLLASALLACGSSAKQVGQGPADGGALADGGIPDGGGSGAWQNVTPAGISLDPALNGFNHGILDVVADKARPGTFYLGTYQQGVWRSADMGMTWTKISAAGSGPDQGRNWGMAITSDGNTIYTFSGAVLGGLWKSTDRGVSWTQTWTDPTGGQAGNDLYMIDMDPANESHLIVTLHGNAPNSNYNSHVFESINGGATWRDAGAAGSNAPAGSGPYAFFIDSNTWLVVHQWGTGDGTWRTTDAGATWSHVGVWEHGHGSCQIAHLPDGVYLADSGNGDRGGAWGVWRSTDKGATFTQVLTGVSLNGVFATPTTLYTNYGWSAGTAIDPNLHHAHRGNDVAWTHDATPPGMTSGSKTVAVVFDGTHSIAVGGFYNAGVWRYVEQ